MDFLTLFAQQQQNTGGGFVGGAIQGAIIGGAVGLLLGVVLMIKNALTKKPRDDDTPAGKR